MVFSQDDCKYAAGFFDGEGNIMITVSKHYDKHPNCDRWRKSLSMRCTVVNTNQDVIRWFASTFNGGFMTSANRNHLRWRETYRWVVSYKKAHNFLQLIYPYLIVKKNQAEIALTFYGSNDRFSAARGDLTDDEYARRLSIRELVNGMNGGRKHPKMEAS
jgi:hypothetical protein